MIAYAQVSNNICFKYLQDLPSSRSEFKSTGLCGSPIFSLSARNISRSSLEELTAVENIIEIYVDGKTAEIQNSAKPFMSDF
jgi:hypothetical protein